jgi:hypothetical protein
LDSIRKYPSSTPFPRVAEWIADEMDAVQSYKTNLPIYAIIDVNSKFEDRTWIKKNPIVKNIVRCRCVLQITIKNK